MLNTLNISSDDYYSGKVLAFGINNTDIIDNIGISDKIIAANRNNPFIKNMLKFIINNLYRFQNAYKFKNGVNKYFNNILIKGDYIRFYPFTLQKELSNKFISVDTLMSIFNNNIVNYNDKIFINLNLDILKELPKYNYLLRMSESQIINSNLFLATLFKFSNKKIPNIVHSGNINGINI